MTDWTPVNEATPEPNTEVLVTTGYGFVRVAIFYDRQWFIMPGEYPCKALAWQALPAPYVAPAAPAAAAGAAQGRGT